MSLHFGTIMLCFVKTSLILFLGALAVFLAEGRRRLPRWFSSHSTTRAVIQTRCRWLAKQGLKCWSALSNIYISENPQLWVHSYKTRHKTGVCHIFPLFSTLLRESLSWFNTVLKSAKDKSREEEVSSGRQPVTPGSRTETISAASDNKHHPVTGSSHSSLTLECGRFVKFLI